jgi:hypothetical protein
MKFLNLLCLSIALVRGSAAPYFAATLEFLVREGGLRRYLNITIIITKTSFIFLQFIFPLPEVAEGW